MSQTKTPLEQLVQLLSRMPGLGPRSARRAALQLLKKKESLMIPLGNMLLDTAENIKTCHICGNIDTKSPCALCTNPRRDDSIICVVEQVSDLWALDRTVSFQGRFHVLGGVLSAMDGISPEQLNVESLVMRCQPQTKKFQISQEETPILSPVQEVILATNLTVDGQTTAHYIADRLSHTGVKITRLAHGVPIGGELDYLDDGTLNAALKARRSL